MVLLLVWRAVLAPPPRTFDRRSVADSRSLSLSAAHRHGEFSWIKTSRCCKRPSSPLGDSFADDGERNFAPPGMLIARLISARGGVDNSMPPPSPADSLSLLSVCRCASGFTAGVFVLLLVPGFAFACSGLMFVRQGFG